MEKEIHERREKKRPREERSKAGGPLVHKTGASILASALRAIFLRHIWVLKGHM